MPAKTSPTFVLQNPTHRQPHYPSRSLRFAAYPIGWLVIRDSDGAFGIVLSAQGQKLEVILDDRQLVEGHIRNFRSAMLEQAIERGLLGFAKPVPRDFQSTVKFPSTS